MRKLQNPWIIIVTGWVRFVSSKNRIKLGIQKIFRSPHAPRNAIEYRHLLQVLLARKTAKSCAKSIVFDILLSLTQSGSLLRKFHCLNHGIKLVEVRCEVRPIT